MSNDNAAVATGVFGGLSVCCFVILAIIGIPLFTGGIIMVLYGRIFYAVYITGIILICISVLMAVIGIIAAILTIYYANKATPASSGRPAAAPHVVVAPTVFTTGVVHQPVPSQPVGYTTVTVQPAAEPRPPAYNDPAYPGGAYPPPPAYSAPSQAGPSFQAPAYSQQSTTSQPSKPMYM